MIFEFCLPTTGKIVPAGPEWFHIRYDGLPHDLIAALISTDLHW
jgi:hypothetical protein